MSSPSSFVLACSQTDFAAQLFAFAVLGLAVEALPLRTARRTRGAPHRRQHGHAVDQFLQPPQGVVLVGLLAARLLRLQHHHAVLGDALVAQGQQPFLDLFGQRGLGDVEAQVHRVRYLVDVLAARYLRADRVELDFVGIDRDHHSVNFTGCATVQCRPSVSCWRWPAIARAWNSGCSSASAVRNTGVTQQSDDAKTSVHSASVRAPKTASSSAFSASASSPPMRWPSCQWRVFKSGRCSTSQQACQNLSSSAPTAMWRASLVRYTL